MSSQQFTCLIKEGSRDGQLKNAMGEFLPSTITLSSSAKFDLQITIKPLSRKELRSNAQNKLAWMWASHLAKETGELKEHVHAKFKARHLAPILARDDLEFAGYWEKFGSFGVMTGYSDFWLQTVASVVSSGDASTKQMAEALTEWEMNSASQGYPLPQPEEYQLAIKYHEKED